ncbi:MAG: zinc ribbon domain-containing protein [Deltaproteobacteria bacterium]|jgi:putative FmdB family regulatory protein
MPIYDYECADCGFIFEVISDGRGHPPLCPSCGGGQAKKLMAAPAIHIKTDRATARIEKRVKDYLKDGKISDATCFADKARSMVKSEKVKRIADKLHEKTGN